MKIILKESNKIPFTFLLVAFVALLAFPQNTKAQLLPQGIDKQTHIEILMFEIERLQSLINILKAQPTHQINAQAYLAIDLSSNTVITEKNSNQILPIASITKLMTAVITLENIDQNTTITLNQAMLAPWGSSPPLYNGLEISVQSLLKATLIQSSNDAANSLSYFLGSNNFVSLMNQKTKELNMTNTTFVDPHGLSPQNISTTTDLFLLLQYINQNHPEIFEMGKENNFWLPDQSGRLFKFRNVNNFYDFPGFVGGKTGYLPEAKQTMASVFNINDRSVAIITLFSNNRQADILSLLNPIKIKLASL